MTTIWTRLYRSTIAGGGRLAAELPADPVAVNPDFWEPPPLRPPKRQPVTESSNEEPAPVVEQLAAFVMDRSQRPALEGVPLPGEGAAYKWLPVLRQCQTLAARWPLEQEQDRQSDADMSRRASGQVLAAAYCIGHA